LLDGTRHQLEVLLQALLHAVLDLAHGAVQRDRDRDQQGQDDAEQEAPAQAQAESGHEGSGGSSRDMSNNGT
jgi:hypothetical protein